MKKGVKDHLQKEDTKPLPVQIMPLIMILRVLDVQTSRQ